MRYYKIINEEIVFFEGNVLYTETETIINPSTELMLENGWSVYTIPEPTEEELLNRAKREKLDEIENYDNSENVNQFFLGGIPMWLDASTRQLLRVSIEAYQATGALSITKWFEGQLFTFPTTAWVTMLNALEVYAAEALNITEMHRANIMAMNSIEEIEDYDITDGYPEKLDLSVEFLIKLA